MRDYGKIHSAIWSSPDFLSYSDDAKLLVFYILTSTHTTMTGAFRLPDGYLMADMSWSEKRVQKGLSELFAKGFCNRCETTNWLWICKFLRWNPPENPNQWKAVAKQAAQIPGQCRWKPDFMRYLDKLYGETYPEEPNPFETVREPFRNQEQEQEQDRGTGTEAVTGTGKTPVEFASEPDRDVVNRVFEFWQQIHKHPKAQLDDKRRKKIKARLADGYSEDDLLAAIRGCKKSPHHMGENETGTVYDDLELICRDGTHVDKFIRLDTEPDKTRMSGSARRTSTAAERWLEESYAEQ